MIKTESKLQVIEVKAHAFKAELNQAEIRQTVSKDYPARTVGNNMQSAFAPRAAYSLPNNTYQSTRVAWVDVPKDWDKADVENRLKELPDARIYQIESFEPILTDNDYAWMTTLSEDERAEYIESRKENQQIVNPETGEITIREGKTVYRKRFFSDSGQADVDNTASTAKRVSAVKAEEPAAAEETPEEVKAAAPVKAEAAIEF